MLKIVYQRAQRAERAGPSHFSQRAGPGRAEKKSARVHLYLQLMRIILR